MDESLRKKLMDLTRFAPAYFTIRTKSGQPKLFELNAAQNYIHRRLEQQLEATGKVRAICLKGRQQGCCFSPEMRVLNNKYQWIELKDINIGDKLFSIDENVITEAKNKIGHERKIRLATVQAKVHFKKEAFEVSLSNGTILKVTFDHRMLFKDRGGSKAEWRSISHCIPGDSIRAFCNPPEDKIITFDDGWFSGLLDGEGSIGSYEKSNPRLAISQVNGAVLEKAKAYLRSNNIHYYELIDKRKSGVSSKLGDKEVHCLRIDRRTDMIKILNRTQPVRLINKDVFIGKSLPKSNSTFEAWVKIESIRSIGEIEVIDLQTSTKTFICEGLISHNSTYIQARYFHKVITTPRGKKAFILTHEAEATKNLFEMTKRYYDQLPEGLCPKADKSSAKELRFSSFDSGYSVGTAGNKGTGRSQTIQLFHGSEVAFWENTDEHATGVLQAISSEPGTEIILESTANGIGNYFHKMWCAASSGASDYQAIFIPWYWQEEYKVSTSGFHLNEDEEDLYSLFKKDGLTKEHLEWRRRKISDLSGDFDLGLELFKQEYPCIVGSQRVGTNKGLIPIKEIIYGYNTNTGSILKQWCTGLKKTILLETDLGYSLQCTADHRILCADNIFREAFLLQDCHIKISIPKFADDLYSIKWNPMPCVSSELIINEDFALFLGFFMGDGSYGGEVLSFVFDKKDINSMIIVKNLVLKLFNREMHERQVSENGFEIRAKIKEVKELFLKLGIVEERLYGITRKVCVPDCIWKSPKLIIKQFIKGLFDSDGYSSKIWANVKFFSKWPNFVKDIQLLLLGFGITSKRNQVQKKSGSGHSYLGNELCLRASEARLFGKEIGFVSIRKQENVIKWLMPRVTGSKPKKIEFQDRVKSINNLGKQLVYDLEIDNEQHIFDAQGILVHNCSAEEAFRNPIDNVFINAKLVMKARKAEVDSDVNLIIGVDPAIGDSDRTAIIRRRGRLAYRLETVRNHNTMELAGKITQIIKSESPTKVFIDCIGIGAGVVDRLQEMGYSCVEGVNVARSANDKSKFRNLRAELYWELRDWLSQELPVQIPDSDELHGDLCSMGYKYTSNGLLQIEGKDQIKARGMPSPDTADALMLTFFSGSFVNSTRLSNPLPLNHYHKWI